MNEIDIKIQQRKEDLKAVRADLERLEAEKKQKEELKWIVAANNHRVILNLAALTKLSKETLTAVLKHGRQWISFEKDGSLGVDSNMKDGLTFYDDTKIIF